MHCIFALRESGCELWVDYFLGLADLIGVAGQSERRTRARGSDKGTEADWLGPRCAPRQAAATAPLAAGSIFACETSSLAARIGSVVRNRQSARRSGWAGGGKEGAQAQAGAAERRKGKSGRQMNRLRDVLGAIVRPYTNWTRGFVLHSVRQNLYTAVVRVAGLGRPKLAQLCDTAGCVGVAHSGNLT